MSQFTIEFVPSGRGKARCPADKNYPNGIALDLTAEAKSACVADLPYPAPECGLYVVQCKLCGIQVAVTAAGRLDDPISVKIPCKKENDVPTTRQN